jgi:hypothetical protein
MMNTCGAVRAGTVDKRMAQPYFEAFFALAQRVVQVPVAAGGFLNTRGRTGKAV